jgi:hypothetical protein
MSSVLTAQPFDPLSGMAVRLFSADMVAAGSRAVQLAGRQVREVLMLDESETSKPVTMIKAAISAGALIGRRGFVDAMAAVIFSGGLDDDERSQLGFAMHQLSQAKEHGVTTAVLKDRLQAELDKHKVSDRVCMTMAAFAIGASLEDKTIAQQLQASFADMVVERTQV